MLKLLSYSKDIGFAFKLKLICSFFKKVKSLLTIFVANIFLQLYYYLKLKFDEENNIGAYIFIGYFEFVTGVS